MFSYHKSAINPIKPTFSYGFQPVFGLLFIIPVSHHLSSPDRPEPSRTAPGTADLPHTPRCHLPPPSGATVAPAPHLGLERGPWAMVQRVSKSAVVSTVEKPIQWIALVEKIYSKISKSWFSLVKDRGFHEFPGILTDFTIQFWDLKGLGSFKHRWSKVLVQIWSSPKVSFCTSGPR